MTTTAAHAHLPAASIAGWAGAIPGDMQYAESLRMAWRAGVIEQSVLEARIAEHYEAALGLSAEAAAKVVTFAHGEARALAKYGETANTATTAPQDRPARVAPAPATGKKPPAEKIGSTEQQRLIAAIRVAARLAAIEKRISRRGIREGSKDVAAADRLVVPLTQRESEKALLALADAGAASTYRHGPQQHEYFDVDTSHVLFADHAADLVAAIPAPAETPVAMSDAVWE